MRIKDVLPHFSGRHKTELIPTPAIDRLDLSNDTHRLQFADLAFCATTQSDMQFLSQSQRQELRAFANQTLAQTDCDIQAFAKHETVMITDPTDASRMIGALIVGSQDATSHILRFFVDPTLSEKTRKAVTDKLLLTATQTARIHGSQTLETVAFTPTAKGKLAQEGWDIQTIVAPDGSFEFHASRNVETSSPKRKARRVITTDNGYKRAHLLQRSHIPHKRSHVLQGVHEDNSSGIPKGAAESKYTHMEQLLTDPAYQKWTRGRTVHITNDVMTGLVIPGKQGVELVFRGKPENEEEIRRNFAQLIAAADQNNAPHALYIVRAHNIGKRMDNGRRVDHTGDLLVHVDVEKLRNALNDPTFIDIYKQTVDALGDNAVMKTSGGINIRGLYELGFVTAINGTPLTQDRMHDAPFLQEAQQFVAGGWHPHTLKELGLSH